IEYHEAALLESLSQKRVARALPDKILQGARAPLGAGARLRQGWRSDTANAAASVRALRDGDRRPIPADVDLLAKDEDIGKCEGRALRTRTVRGRISAASRSCGEAYAQRGREKDCNF